MAKDGIFHTSRRLNLLRKPSTDKYEFYKFLGIIIATSADPLKGNLHDYWNQEYQPESVSVHRNFAERFGMSRDRFIDIRQCLSFNYIKSENNTVILLSL